jgi:hypothetical protein
MTPIRFRSYFGPCAVFLMASAALAQMPAYTQAGPVPPAIPGAKTVFVANAGADSGLFPEPFSGDEDRGYTEFYAALKAAGAYTLVGDPSQADLVLELHLNAPYGPSNPNKPNGTADPLPQFRLTIYDRKTHYVLWTITQSIDAAYMQKNHDKNFDEALAAVLQQFLQVAGKTPAAQGPIQTTH